MIRRLAILAVIAASSSAATAEPCPGNPDPLGTARTLAVDVNTTPRVGHKHFPTTLPLQPKEVVLTFDDGPWPTTTPRVLAALARECVQATFFMLGKNVQAAPALARRVHAAGHTVAHHTYSHPLLSQMPPQRAEAEIDRGIEAVELAIYNVRRREPSTGFFRFPGFASSPALLGRLAQRGIVVFGTDVWASDWAPMTPEEELRLVMGRIEAAGGGIVLLHDTKVQTAAMVPALLRELKKRGFQVVHVVQAGRGLLH